MKKIILATNNAHKITELRGFFNSRLPGKFDLVSLSEAGFTDEIVEDADTFEGNAFKKASFVSKVCGLPALADDSGLEVDFLGGRPGVYSARYAGENAGDGANIKKLLDELSGVPEVGRGARFVSVVCLAFPNGEKIFARGECGGVILTEKRGAGDFGYDPVFYYPLLSRTFAELDLKTKNLVSHRGRALEVLAGKLVEQ